MIATQADLSDATGRIAVVQVDGTAAASDIDLGPPAEGEIWEVLAAWGIHDDTGNARTCAWLFSDGVTNDLAAGGKSMVDLLPLSLYSVDGNVNVLGHDWSKPLRLNKATYLTYRVVAIGAGKKGYIKAIIRKYRGVEAWSNT